MLRYVNQYTKFKVRCFTNYKHMIGANLKNGTCDPDHAPFRGGLSP